MTTPSINTIEGEKGSSSSREPSRSTTAATPKSAATMVERVARAICRTVYDKHLVPKGRLVESLWDKPRSQVLDESIDLHWKNHTDTARAAIEAMREPPENYQDFGTNKMWRDRTTREVWESMIDAAISSAEPVAVKAPGMTKNQAQTTLTEEPR